MEYRSHVPGSHILESCSEMVGLKTVDHNLRLSPWNCLSIMLFSTIISTLPCIACSNFSELIWIAERAHDLTSSTQVESCHSYIPSKSQSMQPDWPESFFYI